MRVYLPATLTTAARLLAEGSIDVGVATAVTADLRLAVDSSEEEDLEHDALLDAAELSLALVTADPSTARRRVVLAADVPEAWVVPAPELGAAVVRLRESVPLTSIASVHVDEAAAQDRVAAGTVDDLDLLWYAVQELPALVAD